jgi:hypothetical protein
MIRPRIVPDAVVDGAIRVTRALGAKFPYCPLLAMFPVQVLDKLVERVPICTLGIGA